MLAMILRAADTVPEDDDVVAGGWGAVMFVLLIAATVFLCFSLVKQLRKAQAAKDAGVFGDEPADSPEADVPRERLSGE
jgi:hypothetical protein